ncbi:MAG: hypothetical protein HZB26_17870 [Candidatus Hydrogenedentes bacterium]|nr:hypothetical protein [Candidatus Hydrogenedentota bacterium]
MKYNMHPERRDAGVTGEGKVKRTDTIPRNADEKVGNAAIENVIMRQNSEFYQERILTYGSWENFLKAHALAVKPKKK